MGHRDELLAVIRAARADVDALVAGYDDEDWFADLGDGWRRKDILAHLALWDRCAVYALTGTPVPGADEVMAGREWNLDSFNESMRARHWDREVGEILADVQAAYEAVVEVVRGASEEETAPGGKVFNQVDIDSAGHYRVHLPIPDRMHDRWPEHATHARQG